MRLLAPPGCVSVSYQGAVVWIGRDGSIDVEEGAAGILAAHGFVSLPSSPTESQSTPPGIDRVAELNRRGLFALLRSKRVPVSLPITNEELRAAARLAIASEATPTVASDAE
jgi:hypothetical protein